MLLDAAAAHGLAFAPLSAATRQKLEALVSVGTIIGNPMDAGFAALTSQDAYLRCIETLLDDSGIDMLLLWVSPKEIAPALVDRCLERFATDVMPRFAAGSGVVRSAG
jgi:acyl-CoA synthetase (NDP forming)